jgi:hypothetical protein
MLAILGNSNSKDTISYDFKFNVQSILNSIMGNESTVDVNTNIINNIDIKSDTYLTNTIKSNIDFDLINKINTKVDINFDSINKINFISHKTTQYTSIDLESKLSSVNYLH